MKLRSILTIGALVVLAGTVNAMDNEEACSTLEQSAYVIALERDKGTPKQEVLNIAPYIRQTGGKDGEKFYINLVK